MLRIYSTIKLTEDKIVKRLKRGVIETKPADFNEIRRLVWRGVHNGKSENAHKIRCIRCFSAQASESRVNVSSKNTDSRKTALP